MLEKLVSSSEAAKILGLSLQGVHYRIRQGKLKSKKTDGKIFVYLDNTIIKNKQTSKNTDNTDTVIAIKNEQIIFLKKSLKWVKNQYKSEIQRLEKNQDKMTEVFQSEISLLQVAFNEMRNIYKLDHKQNKQEDTKDNIAFNMMDIKDFFIYMKQNHKSDMEIKSMILERIKQGDKRFIFNKQTKEVMIYKSDFIDLI